ncbi:BsaA family SipW-dependent biofilm matrix protein [Candidatus Saccharibacteria bacterium]|nr:BsaA family SipW-dependent biofilm matrix protein [Candidatus Saccharibacteria bacterium]
MKNIKNKKPLFLISALLIAAGVGFTVAYNSNDATMSNQFSMAKYKVAYTEEFVSPDSWKPCDETTKTFVVTNEGTTPVHVRIKYEEYWRNKVDSEYLQPVKDGVQLTEIIFQNESDWQLKSDGYYYYKEPLPAGEATSSLFKAVKLNCNANFGKENICTKTANGTVCEKPADEYEGAKYHLKIIAETLQIGAGSFRDVMASQANPRDYYINFAKKAVVNDDVFVANGNGVNRYRENGVEVYYYRGEVTNNNVIWANLCWKIIRSTATGGTKMIYNGEPTTVNGARQCNAINNATYMNGTTYKFDDVSSNAIATVGYKQGIEISYESITPGATAFTFSNDVSRNGNTYTLDTSDGQSVTGTWSSQRLTSAVRYHYFCKNGATSCSNSQIGYIHDYTDENTIYYIPINGYDDIEAIKAASFTNDRDSDMKIRIESWFESKGLAAKEDDLEDAVFCNDREIALGAMKSKDSDASPDGIGAKTQFAASYRNTYLDENGNVSPSLDCSNSRDAFTKDVVNGNGQLRHKVGMITADEVILAGVPTAYRLNGEQYSDGSINNYLYTDSREWTMTPRVYEGWFAGLFVWTKETYLNGTYESRGVRPVVSLKADVTFISGTGEKTDPYIVE